MRHVIDQALLLKARSLTGRSPAIDALIRFAATWLFYLLLLLAIVWVAFMNQYAPSSHAVGVIKILALSVGIAELLSWTMGIVLYRERPFTHMHFTPLVWMPARWKSFPSDHTTIALAIAFTFFFLGIPLWPLLVIFSVIVGVARVAAGVHYPSDVAGGAILAFVVSWLVTHLFVS